MSDLVTIYARLGVGTYADRFVEHGFENWDVLECVTEEDFDFLGVKVGHRRIIQKEIARRQSRDSRAGSQPRVDGEGFREADELDGNVVSRDRMKRRYRRHPKPDEIAPRRPYSAYAMFCNKVRKDLHEENLCFVDLAKVAGRRWQALAPSDKEPWVKKALGAKKAYDAELSSYRETDDYEQYAEYLAGFKSKHPARETTESKRSQRRQTMAERGSEANSSRSRDSIEPAVESLQQKRTQEETGRQEMLTPNVQDLIGQGSQRKSPLSLDHSQHLERADSGHSRADNFRHVRMINPFDHVTSPEVRPYLETFLQRINCFLYVFEPAQLTALFDLVVAASKSLPNQLMSEICLVLALGIQSSDEANEDKMIMWYENGRRYLDDEDWRNELWVMRTMVLISIYHAGDRRGTSRHYLDIAVCIGAANGLYLGQASDNHFMMWSKVWQTVEFLDNELARHTIVQAH